MIKMLGGNLSPQEEKFLEEISQKSCNQFAARLQRKEIVTFFVPSTVLNPKRTGVVGFCMFEIDNDQVASCACELKDSFEYGKWSYALKETHRVLKDGIHKDISVSIQLMNFAFDMVKNGVYNGNKIADSVLEQIRQATENPPLITGVVEFGKKSPIQA